MIPPTFSRKTIRGWQSLIPSLMYGNRCLGSSVALRCPAQLNGWHGNPPDRMSTCPRNFPNGNCLTSVCTGAESNSPASIFATRFAIGNPSLSTKAISRRFGRTLRSPSPMPSYPEQRLMCVIALVVSTFYLSILVLFFFLDRVSNLLPTLRRSSLGSQSLSK